MLQVPRSGIQRLKALHIADLGTLLAKSAMAEAEINPGEAAITTDDNSFRASVNAHVAASANLSKRGVRF